MDRYPYYKYTILLGATRALVHIGIHFTHRVFGLSTLISEMHKKHFGHAGFYRRFIKDFLRIAKPLSNLLVHGTPFEFDE